MPLATLDVRPPDGVWVADVSRAHPDARFRVLAPLVFGAAFLLARVVLALPADWTPLAAGGLVGLVGLWVGWRLGGSRSRPGPE